MGKNNLFVERIQSYLDSKSKKDAAFGEKYNGGIGPDGKKSIEDCCNYILSEVQASGRRAYADNEVYGLALHYYDEGNIGPQPPLMKKTRIVCPKQDKEHKAAKTKKNELAQMTLDLWADENGN